MRMMFQTFLDTTVSLLEVLGEFSAKHEPVDVKDLIDRYTTDVISSCAFGIECNSLKNPDSELVKIGKITMRSLDFRIKVMFLIPERILELFNVRLMPKHIEDYFISIVKNTVDYREKNGVQRNDFMQCLIQLKNGYEIKDNDDDGQDKTRVQNLTLKQVAAECFVFYTAGFETSAVTIAMALLELTLNQNVQERLREEIHSCLKGSDGKITYEGLMEMKYLEQVVNGKLYLIYSKIFFKIFLYIQGDSEPL